MEFTVDVTAQLNQANDEELGERLFVALEGRQANVLSIGQDTQEGIVCVGLGIEGPGAQEAAMRAVSLFLEACRNAGIVEDVDRSARMLSVTVQPYVPVAAAHEHLPVG